MSEGIKAISALTSAQSSYYLATVSNVLSSITEVTKRRLEEYNIEVEEVTSEEEAVAIIEEKEGKGATKWGRLKSRAGWIALDYVTKV